MCGKASGGQEPYHFCYLVFLCVLGTKEFFAVDAVEKKITSFFLLIMLQR